ncbi:MAG: hypothetical protein AB1760_00235 [Pseudomonadota bacterium]
MSDSRIITPASTPRTYPCTICGAPIPDAPTASRAGHVAVEGVVYLLCPECAQAVAEVVCTMAVAARRRGGQGEPTNEAGPGDGRVEQ